MKHCADGPYNERPGKPRLRAQPVDDPPGKEHGDGVDELEHHDDVRVVRVAPIEFDLQVALQKAQDLPVHVVDGRGEEEQRADGPPVFADLLVDLIQLVHRGAWRTLRPALLPAGSMATLVKEMEPACCNTSADCTPLGRARAFLVCCCPPARFAFPPSVHFSRTLAFPVFLPPSFPPVTLPAQIHFFP